MGSVLLWVAATLLALGALPAWGQGENSACTKLLPSTELRGWKEVSGSYLYGKGDGLTAIYNGGYQLYLQHGVQEAAQKLYQRGDLYVTVTAHTMRDASSARRFVQYWRASHRKLRPQPLRIGGIGFWIRADGATTLYWAKGRFFVTVMVTQDDQRALDAGLHVLRAVERRLK
ncbi:MAG: DUF6599 family protein [Armatimonadota bacterium]|nr:DUF6599 family protein [Armatimonadota bacterium]